MTVRIILWKMLEKRKLKSLISLQSTGRVLLIAVQKIVINFSIIFKPSLYWFNKYPLYRNRTVKREVWSGSESENDCIATLKNNQPLWPVNKILAHYPSHYTAKNYINNDRKITHYKIEWSDLAFAINYEPAENIEDDVPDLVRAYWHELEPDIIEQNSKSRLRELELKQESVALNLLSQNDSESEDELTVSNMARLRETIKSSISDEENEQSAEQVVSEIVSQPKRKKYARIWHMSR